MEEQKAKFLEVARAYLQMGGVYESGSFNEFSPILVDKVVSDILLYANREDIPKGAFYKVGELVALAYLTKRAELKALGDNFDGASTGDVSKIRVGDTEISYGSSTSTGADDDVVLASRNYDLALKAFIPQIRKVTW